MENEDKGWVSISFTQSESFAWQSKKKENNFSPKKIQKVLMKVEEMADVFLN